MKLQEIIKILENNFPKSVAIKEDIIGLQIKGREEVKKVLLCLDLTLDVIAQATEQNIDLIISHHPLYWGDKQEEIKKNMFIKSKFDVLEKLNISLYTIHTNADYNENSIAFNQAKKMKLENIELINNNHLVKADLKKEISFLDLVDYIKKTLNIDYLLNSNVILNDEYKHLYVCSGSCGDVLKYFIPKGRKIIFLIGEMKHHDWVYANEHFISVIETSHFSEVIFCEIIKDVLKSNSDDLEINIAKEFNAYKTL